jgi:Ca-activated chloride channel family protein
VTFLNPGFLLVGVALSILVVLAMWIHARRRRRLARFLGGSRAAQRLSKSDLYRLRVERILLLGLASLAFAGAAAEPRWLAEPPPPPPVHSVVLAIDISVSMQASDVSLTRLARTVEVANELVETLGSDRVGLLLFAGTAYSLAPPTYDHAALRHFLSSVPTMASQYDPGTLLSVGIREAATLVMRGGEPDGRRSIVVMGDGEADETEAAIVREVRAAVDQGIVIHTFGVGTEEGGEMVIPQATYQYGGPVVDGSDTPVISRLNEPLLERIAQAGEGEYAHADDGGALRDLHQVLEAPDPDAPAARYELTLLFIFAALTCLLAESLLDIRWRVKAVAPVRRIA